MKAMIEQAGRPEHTQIATFKHLRDQVRAFTDGLILIMCLWGD